MAKTTNTATITHDEWQAALEEVTKSQVDTDPNVLSYFDFADRYGCSLGTARVRLDALVEAGRAKRTTKRVVAGDGRLRTLVAFRLVKK